MNKISNKLFAIGATLLLFSMLFAVNASAQPGAAYQVYKQKYIGAKDLYIKSQQQFENAKAAYNSAKTQEKDEALLNATKAYMSSGIDAMVAYTQVAKENVDLAANKSIVPAGASDNLNNYIAQLEQEKTTVQTITTRQELVNSSKTVMGIWQNVRLESKYYLGIIINSGFEAFFNKNSNVSSKIDSEIQALKSQGVDTTKLESDLVTYNDDISKAQAAYDTAKANYMGHVGFNSDGSVSNPDDANKFLKAADQNIQQANQYLLNAKDTFKVIVTELKSAKPAAT